MRLTLYILCIIFVTEFSQASQIYSYEKQIDHLKIGEFRINESLTFNEITTTEVRRRYILLDLEKNRRYVAHLSYLGSPWIDYKLHILRMPKSLFLKETHNLENNYINPGKRKLSDVAMLQFRTHIDDLRFDFIDGDGEIDNGDFVNDEEEEKEDEENFISILEVRGIRKGFPYEPENWNLFKYNIRVEAFGNFEGLNLVVLAHSLLVPVAIFISTIYIVPFLITIIAGDATKPPPRRDFLFFMLNQ